MTNGTSTEHRSGTTEVISQRLALNALDYPVPARASRLDFMLGALTLVALTVLVVTGIVLTQYYNPTPLGAYGSVRYMITDVPLVAFLRDVHIWSASTALVLVFAHLVAVFWRRGFSNYSASDSSNRRIRPDDQTIPGTCQKRPLKP